MKVVKNSRTVLDYLNLVGLLEIRTMTDSKSYKARYALARHSLRILCVTSLGITPGRGVKLFISTFVAFSTFLFGIDSKGGAHVMLHL